MAAPRVTASIEVRPSHPNSKPIEVSWSDSYEGYRIYFPALFLDADDASAFSEAILVARDECARLQLAYDENPDELK